MSSVTVTHDPSVRADADTSPAELGREYNARARH
jgi:hypothetical protein